MGRKEKLNDYEYEMRLQREIEKRKARIDELEFLISHKSYTLLHPFQTKKIKEEISKLRSEIEALDESEDSVTSFVLPSIICVFLILGGIFFLTFGSKGNISKNEPVSSSIIISKTTDKTSEPKIDIDSMIEYKSSIVIDESSPDFPDDSESESSVVIHDDPGSEQSIISQEDSDIISDQHSVISENDDGPSYEIKSLYTSELNLSATTDYYHIDNTTIYLGNKEGVTIDISCKGIDITQEDIVVEYDKKRLSVEIREVMGYESKHVQLYIEAKKEGKSEIYIATKYDIVNESADNTIILVPIEKLNSRDGKVVYITPTGEKYHKSEKCAGENAMITTLFDAEGWEYDPCGKCAR